MTLADKFKIENDKNYFSYVLEMFESVIVDKVINNYSIVINFNDNSTFRYFI